MSARLRTAAATIIAVLGAASAAHATPYVNVRGFWEVDLDRHYPPPAGVTISCDDTGHSTTGCSGSLSLNRSPTGSATYDVTSHHTVVVTNTTDHLINDFLSLSTDVSAFNPGGPGIGVSIDDPLTQGGQFTSEVRGPGVFDTHHCSVGLMGTSGQAYSPTACGVYSPDDSPGFTSIDLRTLAPGASTILSYTITISASFVMPEPPREDRVPEPASALLLLAGVAIARRMAR